jgi:hypothetical protein
VAVIVTCPIDVALARAESARDAESRALGDCAPNMVAVNKPSTAVERDAADVTDIL